MARMDRTTVVGVFQDRGDAEHAIDDLHRAGFTDEQIGFVAHGGGHTTTADHETSNAGEGAVGGMLAHGICINKSRYVAA